MVAAAVIGGVILLAMICVSWYGWATLPGDARVPIHFGASYNNFVSKRLGLVVHPAAGALVYVLLTVVTRGIPAHGASPGAPSPVILPVLMGVLLIVQVGAIRVARRRSGV